MKKSGFTGLSRKASVPAVLLGGQQEVPHPPVAPGQQGLDVGPFGQVGVHPHLVDAVELPGHQFQALFELGDLGKGGPLERGEGFGDEG